MTTEARSASYAGVDNLEVMAEARNYNAFLQDLIGQRAQADDDILDFGAGSGTLALPLLAAGHRIRCVEPDDSLRFGLQRNGLTVAATLDGVARDSIDLAYSINVFEHIRDDAGAVAALRERLKPGGTLLVYVPAFPILYSSMDRKVGHIRRYRRRQLARLLANNGFEVKQIGYRDSLGFLATLLFKLIGNDFGSINRHAVIAYDRAIFPLSRRLDSICGRLFGKNLFAVAQRL